MMNTSKNQVGESDIKVVRLHSIKEDDSGSEDQIDKQEINDIKTEIITPVCHSFEYHHVEAEQNKNFSIFDINRNNLEEQGNQRPTSARHTNEREFIKSLNAEEKLTPQLFEYHGDHILPQLVFQSSDPKEEKVEENKNESPLLKQKKKKAKLYDYRDNSYLEQKRKARTRKRSEVDFEIGLKLSRFINKPYEGTIDKYSEKKEPTKLLTRRSKLTHTLKPETKSADTSPVGSIDKSINLTGQEKYENELRLYYRNKRNFRRRSISVSPPRTPRLHHLFNENKGTSSQCGSPKTSPPISLNNSPVISRYKRSTFKTILNADLSQSFNGIQNDHLPDIHLNSTRNISSARSRQRAPNIAKMTKDKNKTLLSPKPNGSPQNQNISPGSLRKRVLLNTSLPCGSPTFQRAMKGLKPVEGETEPRKQSGQKGGIVIKEIPPMRSKPSRLSSAGTRRTPTQKTTFSRKNRGSNSTPDNIINDEDYNKALEEIGDKLSDLGKSKDATVIPRKSILKNRRRSIDDLDVGTRKGLAMYLQSKQNNNSTRFTIPS